MKKKLLIEFTYTNGEKEQVKFETDRSYEWTVEQYCRNRSISNHQLLEETDISGKQMLFG